MQPLHLAGPGIDDLAVGGHGLQRPHPVTVALVASTGTTRHPCAKTGELVLQHGAVGVVQVVVHPSSGPGPSPAATGPLA